MTVLEHPTNQHYDLDPRVFGLFLGETRKYSSGWYATGEETLDLAQRQKMNLVADMIHADDRSRVLDIGSGWGALVLHLADVRGCTVTGISPAPRQQEFVEQRARRRGLANRVRMITSPFETAQDLPHDLDAVTALGSVIHMPDLPAALAKARSLLRRGGRMYVSESCFRNAAIRARFNQVDGTDFVRETIFGNGELRPLSELVAAAEDAGFSVETSLDLTRHYHRTIEQWAQNVGAAAARLDAIEPGITSRLTHYLDVSNAGWGYTTKHYALVLRNAR
ncbi:SAM-dependent methyltransferase [Pseudonocardia parietis]|uniref:Cyclopropane-fatty-acyl-phospholipid synthase n=1 Tax=Pseudonocardia parietis TaxID=570936 RepID=A0ABS4W853_9PSEU|nr:class I SAM-dependent methyltransferase [Pseudonocardia parietis]MBP2371814.1 cyclopropane-fatty-acyl-phospholipid synthase [Pseudonocardia parietis]